MMNQPSTTYQHPHRGTAPSPSQLVYDPLHLHARKQGLTAILQAALHEEGVQQHRQNHAPNNTTDMKRNLARAVVVGAMRGSGTWGPRHRPHHTHSTFSTSWSSASCSCDTIHNETAASSSCSCSSCRASCSCSTSYYSANTSSCSQCMRERQHRHSNHHDDYYGGERLSRKVEQSVPSPMQSDAYYQLSPPSQSSTRGSNHSSGVRRTMMAGLDFSIDPPEEAPSTMVSIGSIDYGGQFIPTGHLAGRAFVDDLNISTGGYVPQHTRSQPKYPPFATHLPPNGGEGVVEGAMLTTRSQSPPPSPQNGTYDPYHMLRDILQSLEALKEGQQRSTQHQPTTSLFDAAPIPSTVGTEYPPPYTAITMECDTQTSFSILPDTTTTLSQQQQPLTIDGEAFSEGQQSHTDQIPLPQTPVDASTYTRLQQQATALIDVEEAHARVGIIHQEEQEVLVSIIIPLMLLLIQQQPLSLDDVTDTAPLHAPTTSNLNDGRTDDIDTCLLPTVPGNVYMGSGVVKLLNTSLSEKVSGAGRYGGVEASSSSSLSSTTRNNDPTPPTVVDHSALSDAKRVFMVLDEDDEGSNTALNQNDEIPSRIVRQASVDLAQALWRDVYPTVQQLLSLSHRSNNMCTPPIIQQQLQEDSENADQNNRGTALLTPLDRAALVLSSLHARLAPSTPLSVGGSGGASVNAVSSSLREAIEAALVNAHGTHWLSPLLTTAITSNEHTAGLVCEDSPLNLGDCLDSRPRTPPPQWDILDNMKRLVVVWEEEMSARGDINVDEGNGRSSLILEFHTSIQATHIADSSRSHQCQMDAIRVTHAAEMASLRDETVALSESTLGGYREDITRLRKDLTASQIQCAGLHARLQKLLFMPRRPPQEGAAIKASPPRENEDTSVPIHERFARAHRQALTAIHQQL